MAAKDTASYWKFRIVKRMIRGRESDVYYARLSKDGRQDFINLGTANATKAANEAAHKWSSLHSGGWEAIKPSKKASSEITVGEYIRAVYDLQYLKHTTFDNYSKKFRQIVGDIAGIDSKLKYNPKRSAEWRKSVNAVKLSKVTDEKIERWRTLRLKKFTRDCPEKSRARTSTDSTLRNARSLFGREILPKLKLDLPQVPFETVKIGSMKMSSFSPEIDFDELIEDAGVELDSDLHLIFLLAIGCGLRRSEIDRLRREHVNLKAGQLVIVGTEDGDTKTEGSIRTVKFTVGGALYQAISDAPLGVHLCCPKASLTGKRRGEAYRCDLTYRKLVKWLRGKGIVKAQKPIHYLRKAAGDKLAQEYGIHVAANTLGNSIKVAHAAYHNRASSKAII